MMSDTEIIEVVSAHAAGKQIECRELALREHGVWCLVNPNDYVRWNFESFRYRVKPEPPKPREWNVLVSTDGKILESPRPAFDQTISFYCGTIKVREVIE